MVPHNISMTFGFCQFSPKTMGYSLGVFLHFGSKIFFAENDLVGHQKWEKYKKVSIGPLKPTQNTEHVL
jgi:hypothetical protein